MARFAAFLRAVNVGGTGKLPMADLRAMCAEVGFENARTYIASGNVVFDWDGDAEAAQELLAEALAAYAGKPVGVMVRTANAADFYRFMNRLVLDKGLDVETVSVADSDVRAVYAYLIESEGEGI